MFQRTTFPALVALLLAPAIASAQGVLVVVDPSVQVRLPRPVVVHHHHIHPPTPVPPPMSYKIKELDVQAKVADQVARVQVSQTFVNTGSRQMEVSFIFPLPYDGAIDRMTFLVDGKEYPAKLLDAKKARQIYESIVRKNQDPALLEWIGTGMFQTSVFPVPPGASRTVSLRYSQLCRMQEGLTDFLFPLSTAKYTSGAVEKINFRVSIESNDRIKNVYSPTHNVTIKRPDENHAVVTWKAEQDVPDSDFRLLYDVGRGKMSARVLSYRPEKDEDGYFLLLASPDIKPITDKPIPKTVLFVLDRSGSMTGKKIEQARESLKFVLNNLREDDVFNIIAYDSEVESFRPELQRCNEKSRKAALGFVEGIYAGGSTNIDGALKAALGQLDADREREKGEPERPAYILFLTDGLPTVGEMDEMKIVDHVKSRDKDLHARLFVLGVGYDVNSRLLDRLAAVGFGQSEFVRPNEDIEDRISRLYRRIQSPVLTDVEIEFTLDDDEDEYGKPVNRVYPSGAFDLFAGDQLVVVGRYKRSGDAKVVVRGEVNGRKQKFDFPAKLVKQSDDETQSFVQQLWAVRRVGEILDELDLKGKNQELIDELVRLATRHGIVTPYTSFLADDGTNIFDTAANAGIAGERLVAQDASSGRFGFKQREFKGQLKGATNWAAAPASRAPSPHELARSDAKSSSSRMSGGMGMGGGMGGMGMDGGSGPVPGKPAAPMLSEERAFGESLAKADREIAQAGQAMRNVGSRAFYYRDKQWIDSTLTEKQQAAPTRVKQFSKEYFALANRHGRAMSQYLVFDEPVLLNVSGRAYLIEP